MKRINSIISILTTAALMLSMFSCGSDDDNPTPTTPEPEATYSILDVTKEGIDLKIITGEINEDLELTADKNWVLSGGVFVQENTTLTIAAGTTVYGDPTGGTAFLSIQRGGKIMAEGSATSPIVMTSLNVLFGNALPGDWGGLIINGKAPTNAGDEGEGEGGSGKYGGIEPEDNSGVIRYLRVEYGGKILGTDNELNCIALYAVGSGTTIEYIQAYMGEDDGIEFFGGNVSVKYALSVGALDDSFDWTEGWSGNGQFWVVQQTDTRGDRGIEADNNSTNNLADPVSNPTIANVTLIGNNGTEGSTTGMRLREGTKGKIYNALVTGFKKHGVRVSNDDGNTNTITTDNMNDGSLLVTNSIIFENDNNFKDCDPFANDTNNSTETVVLEGVVGSSSTNAKSTLELGSWFESVNFVGAINPADNWAAGWAKDASGNIIQE